MLLCCSAIITLMCICVCVHVCVCVCVCVCMHECVCVCVCLCIMLNTRISWVLFPFSDMICALGESTGYYALKNLHNKMSKDPEGRLLLEYVSLCACRVVLNSVNGHDLSLCVQSGTGIVWTPFHVFGDVEMHVSVSDCNVFRDQFVVKVERLQISFL